MHSGTFLHWLALLFASHAAPSLPALRVTIRCKARRCLGVFVCFLPYFFILSLFNAFWYFFALALCSLSVFAKLCVPEKSSLAHMYR